MTKLDSPVRKLRQKLRLNQANFSRLIGKSQSFLSDLENGATDIPEDAIENLRELTIDVDSLLNEHRVFMEKRLESLKQYVIDTLQRER